MGKPGAARTHAPGVHAKHRVGKHGLTAWDMPRVRVDMGQRYEILLLNYPNEGWQTLTCTDDVLEVRRLVPHFEKYRLCDGVFMHDRLLARLTPDELEEKLMELQLQSLSEIVAPGKRTAHAKRVDAARTRKQKKPRDE